MTQNFPIIGDKWEIVYKIGSGTFSQLYAARNLCFEYECNSDTDYTMKTMTSTQHPLVAIKVSENNNSNILSWESEVMMIFHDSEYIPKFIDQGKLPNGHSFVIMELLGGEDISHLRNRIRNASPSGLISLPASVYIAKKMLKCIEAMHSRGYIHRDIKPANFVRKSQNGTNFCLIDFGIAKLYRSKDGNIRQEREKAEFRGTTTYASPHVHQGFDQCPRDDLFSWMYVLLDLICGKLPWVDASRNKDKSTVSQLKNEYLNNPSKLIQDLDDICHVIEKEHETPFQHNFPDLAQGKCLEILQFISNLDYNSTVNYEFIYMQLDEMVPTTRIISETDVSDEKYQGEGFQWYGGINNINLNPSSYMIGHNDVAYKSDVLQLQVRSLYRSIQQFQAQCTDNSLSQLRHLYLFQRLLTQLFDLQTQSMRMSNTINFNEVKDIINEQNLSNFFEILKITKYFFYIQGQCNHISQIDFFNEFLKFQKVRFIYM